MPLGLQTRGMMFFYPFLFSLLLAGIPDAGPAHAQPQQDLETKNILILHSHEANAPVFVETDHGLSTALRSGGMPVANHFFQSLDLRRNPGPEYRRLLVEEMRVRYGHRKLDMIITMYPEALEFLLSEGGDIFPCVPILALYLPKGFQMPETKRRIIGHSTTPDVKGTLEIALKLVPGAKRAYVVSGAHEVDRRIEDQARGDLKKWEGRLEFRYLSGIPFDDVLTALSTAPPDTIVLLLIHSRDVSGRNYMAPDLAQRLSRGSTAPIFGLLEVALGYGIAGGSLINFERIGKKAGELALDVLKGVPLPENVPACLDVPPVPMFDWRQLRKWGLSESDLPKGSVIINRGFTLWDFKYYIIGTIVFCLLETTLILFLIDERRRKSEAEESLKTAEEKYRSLFETALEGIYETSPQGEFLTANPALANMLGYDSPEEVISSIRDSANQVWSNPNARADYIRLLDEKNVVRGFECQFLRKDGTKFWASLSTRRVSASDGKTIYYSGFIDDVSERKQAVEALRESEERLRAITFSVADWIWEVDENGVYTYSSQKGFDLLGRSHEEIIGKTPFDFMPPDEAKRVAAIFSEIAANKAPIRDLENWSIRKNGESICLLTNGVPIMDEEGNLKGYRGVDRDITERLNAEAEARQRRAELANASRLTMIGKFTSTLAHEINQPLTAILSNAEAARRFLGGAVPDIIEVLKILDDIIRDDRRAVDVVRKVRALVRKEKPLPELVDLNKVICEVITFICGESRLPGLSILMKLYPDLKRIHGDRTLLQQVMLNLILNSVAAVRNSPQARRKIIVRTAMKDPDTVKASVTDFGTGIDQQITGRLFEPFCTTKPEGLGMGLFICKEIIKEHGGNVEASNNPGGGATVGFTLPVQQGETGHDRGKDSYICGR